MKSLVTMVIGSRVFFHGVLLFGIQVLGTLLKKKKNLIHSADST